ncbi:MAG: radical SAM protein [Campylobacteraceae bacterium]|nr:radical SAM protein [Campylobacteraceae bacterium]
MFNKKFYLTLVPTNECGFACEYCYTSHNLDDKTRISLNDISKIMEIISQQNNSIEILFIGGEPTMVGYEYFNKIMDTLIDIQSKNNLNLQFTIQTNGIHLNEKWIKLFQKYKFRVGVSFDGFSSDIKEHRPHSDKIEKNIKILQKYKMSFSILSVFNNETIDNLIDNYLLMNKLQYAYKILPMNDNGHLEEKYIIKFNEENQQKILEFAKKWLYDTSCNIQMKTFHSMFYTLFLDEMPLCNSCIENRVSIRPNGSLFPCGRPYDDKYKISHIDNIKEFNQLKDNDGYKNLINLKNEKINNCIDCKYLKVCEGGCVSNNILDNSYADINGFYCKYTIMMLDIFTPLVDIAKKDIKNGNIEKYNPILINDLKFKGLI